MPSSRTPVTLLLLALACDRGTATKPPPGPQGSTPATTAVTSKPLELLAVELTVEDQSEILQQITQGRAIFLAANGSGAFTLERGCHAEAEYSLVGATPRDERVADARGVLEMTIVGRTTARLSGPGRDGACDRVTHVVGAFDIGAYEAKWRSSEMKGGKRSLCATATANERSSQCSTVVRMSLTPIDR